MKITIPLGRNLPVRAVSVEKTSSGLYLPDSAKSQVQNGERIKLVVVAWGAKVEEKYELGDTLIISSSQVVPVVPEPDDEKFEQEKHYLVHETQVVGLRREREEIPF